MGVYNHIFILSYNLKQKKKLLKEKDKYNSLNININLQKEDKGLLKSCPCIQYLTNLQSQLRLIDLPNKDGTHKNII